MNPQLKTILVLLICILAVILINIIHPITQNEAMLLVVIYIVWKMVSALV